ncbi:hypothetical protein [Prescottella agglutinans]|uniref:Uncharacterized protein n=1 Tax=Prescottella agglutinans TaxID=1644129 RepID=A0ABT6MG94_9NOCA|nr:hypothetical protein [Prescottella agglutinans]MDH6282899.1 hypothetical protein [Prescottella agglutinans]
MSGYEYRIEYTILRAPEGSDDFVEVGFGSSGSSTDLNSAAYDLDSQVQNRMWETEPGMPDPNDVDGDKA